MHADFQPTVYILANRKYGTTYVGVTSKLKQRIYQHREGMFEGFSKEKGTKILVWYEQHSTAQHSTAQHNGNGDYARKANQEMEPAVENRHD